MSFSCIQLTEHQRLASLELNFVFKDALSEAGPGSGCGVGF